jgi:ADP-heptose:LPS heptosyltransferase
VEQSGLGFLAYLPQPPRKVVMLRASRIGDFVCALPTFRALRAGLPGAEISLITLPLLQGLAERIPYIDRFIPFPGFPGIASQLFQAADAVQFFNKMIAEEFDLALQIHGSGVYANPFTLLLGAKHTVGFIRPGDPPDRLDGALTFPQTGHEVQRLLRMAEFLGITASDERRAFPLWPEDHTQAQALLAGLEAPLIGIHPGAHSLTRRWSLDRFASVGKELQRRHGGTLVILGGPGEREISTRLVEMLGGNTLDLTGKTSLPVSGAVIQRLDLLITNDSGPAHIAYALKTPAVVVWGGEDLERYGPPQAGPFRVLFHPVACRPCGYAECPIGYVCLEHITPEAALEACEEVLRS